MVTAIEQYGVNLARHITLLISFSFQGSQLRPHVEPELCHAILYFPADVLVFGARYACFTYVRVWITTKIILLRLLCGRKDSLMSLKSLNKSVNFNPKDSNDQKNTPPVCIN